MRIFPSSGGEERMVVYIDLIFLLNFSIDWTLLWATAQARRMRMRWWRGALSSAIGASYVLMLFLPSLSFMFTFLIKCVISVLMIIVAFGFGGLQSFLRNLGLFYLINFAAAGAIFGIGYVLQSSGELMNGMFVSRSGGLHFRLEQYVLWFIVPTFILALWLYRVVWLSSKRREAVTGFMAEVRIYIEGVETVCQGLIDTGNQLYDPLTRTPVMVLEASEWKSYMPDSWLQRIKNAEVDQIISAIGTEECLWQDRLRLVPYRGVNRGTQFMLAVKPDKVVIIRDGTPTETNKVLVALDGGRLSSDGSYQAIIHPMLVESCAS
jgi:stage II sporulation protein GA (sporulation sigma-E factor processing peptidase)